jgi:hypothetical protein
MWRGIFLVLFCISHLLKPTGARSEVSLREAKCALAERLLLKHFSSSDEQRELRSAFGIQLEKFSQPGLAQTYCHELQINLVAKLLDQTNPLKLTSKQVLQQAINYEGFRIETYLSAGVSPKRYFGFFDEQGDTAELERIARVTIIDAVKITNQYAKQAKLKTQITEKEVAVTFLAEGGALLLTNPEGSTNRVHPVRQLGLDDFRAGFSRYPKLITRFDQHFRTKLGKLLLPFVGKPLLLRPMSFRESLLTTTLMYLYEKELAAHAMQVRGDAELMNLSLDEQFITTSLVYNSGILFSQERVKQIADFSTGAYLAAVNLNSKRPNLRVYAPDDALEQLRRGQPLPAQLTSWSAVYHILQRYGAWVGLERFSDAFRHESFRRRQ